LCTNDFEQQVKGNERRLHSQHEQISELKATVLRQEYCIGNFEQQFEAKDTVAETQKQRMSALTDLVSSHGSTIQDLKDVANARNKDLADSENQVQEIIEAHRKSVAELQMQLKATVLHAHGQDAKISELEASISHEQLAMNELRENNSKLQDRLGNRCIIRERLS
jgi:chromosome segregation ATPase